MSSPPTPVEVDAPPLSAAQARIVAAAQDLFARNGVGGTSLQMIAEEIGVTKAAVYHQYNAKDEIVCAVAEAELARLEHVVAAAESEPSAKRARDALVAGMVDLAVERRHEVGSILSDPVIVGFFAEHDGFHDVMDRMRTTLLGDDAGPKPRVRLALLIAAISGAVMHPVVVDLDDDTLRAEVLHFAQRAIAPR